MNSNGARRTGGAVRDNYTTGGSLNCPNLQGYLTYLNLLKVKTGLHFFKNFESIEIAGSGKQS